MALIFYIISNLDMMESLQEDRMLYANTVAFCVRGLVSVGFGVLPPGTHSTDQLCT